MTDEASSGQKLINVVLEERTLVRRKREVEHERAVAIYDLLEENSFSPTGDLEGPFILHVAVEAGRLRMGIHDAEDQPLTQAALSLSPLRSVIRDYFIVCESYYDAIKHMSPSKIEAIDMGRRGLHDTGSHLLKEMLAPHVTIDPLTARRLFTLVCVLQLRG